MQTQDKTTARKPAPAPALTPAPALIPAPAERPALVLLGEPALDAFREWVARTAPNESLIILTAEVSAAEQEAARFLARISEAKQQRRKAAFDAGTDDAGTDDAAALTHSRLIAELEVLPARLSAAEGRRVDANLRYLACLREFAKSVVLQAQKAMKPLLEHAKETQKQISVSDGRGAYAPTLTDGERASEEAKLNEISKQLRPLRDTERLAEEVYTVAAIRAEHYSRNTLPEYQDRLILLSEYGRGVAVEAAEKAAYSRALAQVKN